MRRSAAPSALSENYCKAKRVKFEPPFRAIAAESENFAVKSNSNRDINESVDGMSRHTSVLQKSDQSSQKRIFNQRDSKPHLNKGFSSVDNKDGLKRALLTLRNGSLSRDVHRAPSGNPVTITTDEPVLASRDPLTTNCHTSPNEPSALSCDPKSLATCTTAKECSQNPPKPASSLGLPVPAGQAQLRYGSGATSGGSSKECKYYSVVWCKHSKKKHKKWEGDAFLIACGRTATLKDTEGKHLAKDTGYKSTELSGLVEGSTLVIGAKEIEVMNVISQTDWESGKCFLGSSVQSQAVTVASQHRPRLKKGFSDPRGEAARRETPKSSTEVNPLHNPSANGALVMPRPSQAHQWASNPSCLPLVDVVVDPHLSKHLRPHQREGVAFLYECVMGMRDYNGQGCILADDMGLGKTLQCITLVWTLCKQSMYKGKPEVKKAIIITPGSLVKNWSREFQKWLGSERIKPYAVSSDKKIDDYLKSLWYPVLIISYEMFVRAYEQLKRVSFDLIVCDEGHRLKNTTIKTTSLISSLTTRRRIVLTGTPVQNDLKEFYSIVEFCNPGILGSHTTFKKVYEEPIVLSQQPSATAEEKRLGENRANELTRMISLFCLRRTQDINNHYLPPKVEKVVFCEPSKTQLLLYRNLLNTRMVKSCFNSHVDGNHHLACILALKKLCNHPSLLFQNSTTKESAEDGSSVFSLAGDLLSSCSHVDFVKENFLPVDSGKLFVLSAMLHRLHSCHKREKIVLISNYTQTLNMFECLCKSQGHLFLRLDGSTATAKRQNIVEQFNSPHGRETVFLLSSKAGGVGLNLIGASRLVLYDIDWNPANDLQAMARVWRDGQKHKVHIYRLLTTGTIEEKIYQRQISKQGLSGAVVDSKSNVQGHFSKEDLKDLFTLQEGTVCDTHDLLGCTCLMDIELSSDQKVAHLDDTPSPSVSRSFQLGPVEKDGRSSSSVLSNKRNITMDELRDWEHITTPLDPDQLNDSLLISAEENITFIFQNETNEQNIKTN